ncbi:FAD-dependent monooxygenase [Nonomuraea fuscirosea]
MDDQLADRYRDGRVFIAGDAAHVHPIAGGLGMNTGIQDAYNLGWKLALAPRGQARDSLLDTYERERRPVAASVLKTSGASMTALFSAKPLMTFLRDRIILPLMRSPAVTKAIVSRTSQLGVNYRDSELSVGEKGKVRPGDRAPDSPCGHPVTVEQSRLFDLFRGPHFTLLQFGTEVPGLAERLDGLYGDDVRVHRLEPGPASRRYGAGRGTLVLVRPDGYVAVRTRSGDAVADYLRTISGV